MRTKLSISLPNGRLERADKVLTRADEGRSASIALVLAQTIREADEADTDAAYGHSYADYPITPRDLEHSNALARAAVRSGRRTVRRGGAAI